MSEKEFLAILKEVLENKLKFEPSKQQAIYESVKNKIEKKI